jgi:hypothetical protein
MKDFTCKTELFILYSSLSISLLSSYFPMFHSFYLASRFVFLTSSISKNTLQYPILLNACDTSHCFPSFTVPQFLFKHL